MKESFSINPIEALKMSGTCACVFDIQMSVYFSVLLFFEVKNEKKINEKIPIERQSVILSTLFPMCFFS